MKNVNCPECGNRILELARGELDDQSALHAEEHLQDCAHCSEWWEASFSSHSFKTVDRIVADAFQEVSIPRRRRSFAWAAAAASIFLMLAGVSWLNMSGSSNQVVPTTESAIVALDFESTMAAAEIQTISFEEADLGVGPVLQVDAVPSQGQEEDVLFKDGSEDGGFGSWTIHT